jgi:hypothetical protein
MAAVASFGTGATTGASGVRLMYCQKEVGWCGQSQCRLFDGDGHVEQADPRKEFGEVVGIVHGTRLGRNRRGRC